MAPEDIIWNEEDAYTQQDRFQDWSHNIAAIGMIICMAGIVIMVIGETAGADNQSDILFKRGESVFEMGAWIIIGGCILFYIAEKNIILIPLNVSFKEIQ